MRPRPNTNARIVIAGYGTIGQYAEEVFRPYYEAAIYDPPLGLGSASDLNDADFVVLCVPTPSLSRGECDTSIVEELVAQATPRQAIICHSTLSVGTTERLISAYGKPLVYVPEYAGESADHPYRRLENRHFYIYGGYEPEVSRVRDLFEAGHGRDARHFVVRPVIAEIAKYMENSFLAMKVAFCNEFYDLCQAFGADYSLVRELWLQDGRMGRSHTLVTPERGYGGKCLPKDVAAICRTGRDIGVPMEVMETVQRTNTMRRRARALNERRKKSRTAWADDSLAEEVTAEA